MSMFYSIFLLVVASAAAESLCNIPPSLWCSSYQFAQQCDVVDQCAPWLSPSPNSAPKVNLTLYSESLCPDCKQFILSQLEPAYHKLRDIANFNVVMYGNANERYYSGRWLFYCQHGSRECYGNVAMTCANHLYPNTSLPFMFCAERYGWSQTNVQYCAHLNKMNTTRLFSCIGGSEGNQLEHQAALKTNALNPRHQYVPWVTLNGHHTAAIQQEATRDLVGLICQTYTGAKPQACNRKTTAHRCEKKRDFFSRLREDKLVFTSEQ